MVTDSIYSLIDIYFLPTKGSCIEYHDHGISPTDIYIHYTY